MVVLNMTGRLVVVLVLATASAGQGQPAPRNVDAPRVIHVAAERFAFTPSEITIDEGSVVELRLTSDDTDHGFRVYGLGDPNVVIPKRGRGDARITIDAKEAGSYRFECSHVCGAGHGFMRGVIRVKPRGQQ
jgi:cytochrome c oxidase subunit 2